MAQSCRQVVTYNGLSCPFTSVVYDIAPQQNEAGTVTATDVLVTVSGWVTADSDDVSIVEKTLEMQRLWEVPRRKFTVAYTPKAGGATEYLFDFGPFDIESRDVDVAWGPTPGPLRIGNVVGGLTAPYTFTIRARTKRAWTAQGVPQVAFLNENPILSFTRAYSFDIDENGGTTRTTSGSVVVARNLLGNGQGPSYVRDVVYPPIPPSFRRLPGTFDIAADGLSATYRVVDQEVGEIPPSPITSAEAEIVGTTTADGGMASCSLSGEFKAARTTPKSVIVTQIAALLAKYLKAEDIVDERMMAVRLYGPTNGVRFSFRWRSAYIVHDPTGSASAGAMAELVLTKPPTATNATYPGPWGTANQTEYVLNAPFDGVTMTLAEMRTNLASARLTDPGARVPQPVPPTPPPGKAAGPQPDMSGVHKATPILSYVVQYGYTLKTGLKAYVPKVAGKGPIFVRTRPPTMAAVITGVVRYARRPTDPPLKVPSPPAGYTVIEGDFTPENGQPIGSGEKSEYRLSWKFMAMKSAAIEGGNNAFQALNIMEPADIRRAGGAVEKRLDGPGAIVPQ